MGLCKNFLSAEKAIGIRKIEIYSELCYVEYERRDKNRIQGDGLFNVSALTMARVVT